MSYEFFQKPTRKPEIIQESINAEAASELVATVSRTTATLYTSACNLTASLVGKSQDYVDNFELIRNKLGEVNQAIQQLNDEAAGLTVNQEAIRKKV